MTYSLFAFDCGTTNWRIQRLSYDDAGKGQRHPLGDPQRVALSTFNRDHLPAALLLDEKGQARSYGKSAYQSARDPRQRPFLRDAFKLCLGNRQPTDAHLVQRRYAHAEALDFTRLLLEKVVARLEQEKPGSLDRNSLFFFAHPVHWGREQLDGSFTGDLLPDFAGVVRRCFPEPIRANIRFVPEPEAALISLAQSGQLPLSDDNRFTLVIDAGGGTTDFVAGRLTPQGLQDIRYHGEPHGGGLFDDDLARYLVERLGVPPGQQANALTELRDYGRQFKEELSRQFQMDELQPISLLVSLALISESGRTEFLNEQVEFGREQFEARTERTTAAFKQLVLQALVEMDLRKSDIGRAVLVGGGANLYLTPRLLRDIFREATPVVYGDPPEETIVRGAALWHVYPRPTQKPAIHVAGPPAAPAAPLPVTELPPADEKRDQVFTGYEAFQERRRILLALIQGLAEIMTALQVDQSAVRQLAQTVHADTFKVLVLGEFKRGKSTFINALFGEEILPAYAVPTTAIIVEVKWDAQPRAILHYLPKDHMTRPPQEIPVEEIGEYIVIRDTDKRIEETLKSPYEKVELFWPLAFCRNGVEIIDTPGSNNDPATEQITMEYLKIADAVLFILSSGRLGPSVSEDQMIDAIHIQHSDIFFICNRFDQLLTRDRKRVQQYAYQKLGPLTRPNGEKRIFFISAADALDGRLEGKSELVEQSGILPVEAALEDFLARERGKVKLMPAINQLRREVNKTREVITLTQIGLDEDLQAKYAYAQTELDELQAKRQFIISRITNTRHEIWHDVNKQTEKFYDQVSVKIEPWLKNYEIKNQTRFRLSVTKEQIEKVVKELSEFFDSQVQKEFATWQGETLQPILDLRLKQMVNNIEQEAAKFVKRVDQLRLNLMLTTIPASTEEVEEKVSATEHILSAAGGFPIGGVGAADVGAVFGMNFGMKEIIKSLIPQTAASVGAILLGITNPWVLVPMLLGAGGVQGIFKLNAANEEIKKKMAEKFCQVIREQKTDQARRVADMVAENLHQIEAAMDQGMAQEIKNIQDQLDVLLARRENGETHIEQRKAELQSCQEKLNRLDQALDELVIQL